MKLDQNSHKMKLPAKFIGFIGSIGLLVVLVFINSPTVWAQTSTTGGFIFGSENGEFVVKEKNTGQIRMRIDTQGNFIAQQQQSGSGTSSNFVFNGGFEQDMDKYVAANSTQLDPYKNRISDGWEQNYMVGATANNGNDANGSLCLSGSTSYCEYTIDTTSVKGGAKALTLRATAANYTASVASMAYPVERGQTYKGEFSYRCDANITNFKLDVIFFAGANKLVWNHPAWTKSDGTTEPAVTNAYRGRSGTTVSLYNGGCTAGTTYTTITPVDVAVPSNCIENTTTGINDGATGTAPCTMAAVLTQNSSTAKLFIDEVKLGTNITASSNTPLTAANVSSGQFGSATGGGAYSFGGNVGIGTTVPAAKLDIAGVTSTISNTAGDINIVPATNLIVTQGNVGIGTTGPGSKLQVDQSPITINSSFGVGGIPSLILRRGDSTADQYYGGIFWKDSAGTTGWELSSNNLAGGGAQKLNIGYKTSNLITFDNSGNVGIGTIGPGAPLHLVGAKNATYKGVAYIADSTTSAVGVGGGITFLGKVAPSQTYYEAAALHASKEVVTDTNYATSLIFRTTNSAGTMADAVTINSSGNVGIGTTGPGYLLDVRYNSAAAYNLFQVYHPNSGGVLKMVADTATTSYVQADTNIFKVTGFGNTPLYVDTGNNRVGIGTAGPGYKLDVNGSMRAAGVTRISTTRSVGANVNDWVELGNFGINGAGAYAKVRIYGHWNNNLFSEEYEAWATYYTNYSTGWVALPPTNGVGWNGAHNFSVDAYFPTSGGPVYLRARRISGGGWAGTINVEIETNGAFTETSGSGIGGTVAAGYANTNQGWAFPSYAGVLYPTSQGLFIDTSGNVGIGTTAPAQKLSVAGTIESTTGGVKFPDGTTQTSAAAGGVPSGMIAFFASACPTGWTEYTALRGRAVVGTPLSGTNAGTVGTAFSNLEDRTHTHTGPSHTHSIPVSSVDWLGVDASGTGGTSGPNLLKTRTWGKDYLGGHNNDGVYRNSLDWGTTQDTGCCLITYQLSTYSQTSGSSGTGSTGPAATSSIIPFIQLTACQKT